MTSRFHITDWIGRNQRRHLSSVEFAGGGTGGGGSKSAVCFSSKSKRCYFSCLSFKVVWIAALCDTAGERVCVEHSQQPRRDGAGSRGDRTRSAGHGRRRSQHQRDATPARERRPRPGDPESPVRLGRRRPHHPRRPRSRGLHCHIWIGWSDATAIYHLYVVGQDVVLNWRRFVTLFKQNWIDRFKKSLALAPSGRSDCKCCKMFTFSCPTPWRPERLA